MRYLILVLILVVLAVTGAALGGFGFLPGVFAAEKAWLEIISPAILEIDESGAVIRELRSGDEISSGSRLRGEAGSFANIHFPDGSAARIDGETTIILRDSEFDAKTGKLIVRFELVAGRIWCKIFSLATDDSAWEVITPTAVAVVRGTAFGVEYLNNKTSVVGAENMVEVIPVDSETKELIKAASAKVLADDVLKLPRIWRVSQARRQDFGSSRGKITKQPRGSRRRRPVSSSGIFGRRIGSSAPKLLMKNSMKMSEN